MIASNGSPNLYRALTELAAHPVGIREGLSYESRLGNQPSMSLPTSTSASHSPEEALRVAKALADAAESMGYRFGNSPAEILGISLFWYPHARRELLAHGLTAERIDAMPVVQVVMLAWWKEYTLIRDDYFKWLELPDNEVEPYGTRSYNYVRAAEFKGEGGPFVLATAGPSVRNYRPNPLAREIDQLRVVEALRLHAAQTGRWPDKLDDITVVPVPLDPWNHKPFEYTVKNGVATSSPSTNPRWTAAQPSIPATN